ncbi:serine carboxypeptidase-like 19 isoform X2 [Beta vulgaris subsp. vulgaris]|uniref:serine carboxypeptidase-like 19 isoform X2 n=1 Tax=Beta vulgaris subsp. vulgaris TaxID=3555 RepID=UPI0020368647|nr:serine carboxypeptidase-like 19 isoform X2 [Beta vulgaris subsp. vulgaris]
MRTIKVGFCFLQVVFLLTIWLSNVHVVVPRSHKVKYLPGFDGPLPFSLETGYIGVDQGEEAQLFYYFFESENNPKEDPLLVWLTGGPLCSAMSAILYEIGPIQFEEKNDNQALPKLVLRSHSWTKLASIIFVDFPTGAGFSYAKTPRTNYSGDYRASHNINEFLRKWLTNHPQFLSNHLYLGGDSYTGFTLPLYFVDMVSGNERGLQPFLNLKGYILGNPATDRLIDGNYQVAFAHGMGLISDEFYESLEVTCGGKYQMVDASNIKCRAMIKTFEWGLLGIQITMTLEDYCDIDYLRDHEVYGMKRRIIADNFNNLHHLKQLRARNCRKEGYIIAQDWMNKRSVQANFHIRKGTIGKWKRCNYAHKYSYEVSSSVPYHLELSAKGFRSLIYSFTRTYTNKMTFATVKGAGHTAPEYKPKQCASMFKRWIQGEAL